MPTSLHRRHALLAAGGLILGAPLFGAPLRADAASNPPGVPPGAPPSIPPGVPPGVPSSGRLAFDAFRKGSPLGTHVLVFAMQGGAMTVRSTVHFEVKLGPIPLFRYHMETTEHWRDGRLADASSTADDNGKPGTMTARAVAEAADEPAAQTVLEVDGSKSGRYRSPPGSLISTHWNRAELKAPSVNPQDGSLMRFAVVDRGIETITAAGASIKATHYALTGPAKLDLWYDAGGVWSALRATADDGSVIEYRLT